MHCEQFHAPKHKHTFPKVSSYLSSKILFYTLYTITLLSSRQSTYCMLLQKNKIKIEFQFVQFWSIQFDVRLKFDQKQVNLKTDHLLKIIFKEKGVTTLIINRLKGQFNPKFKSVLLHVEILCLDCFVTFKNLNINVSFQTPLTHSTHTRQVGLYTLMVFSITKCPASS